jgi:hypothetical protein
MKEDMKTLMADMSIICAIDDNGGDTALHFISMHACNVVICDGWAWY